LKNHFEAVLGYDLDPFFNDFIYGTGHPTYTIKWNNSGQKIAIRLASQTRSLSSTVTYFRTPVVIKISNGLTGASLKDTTVVIYDQNGSLSYAGNGISAPRAGNTLAYNLSFTPVTVTYDPNDETLSTGSVSAKDATINTSSYSVLPINIIDFNGIAVESANRINLKLQLDGDEGEAFLERSSDGVSFIAVSKMEKVSLTDNQVSYRSDDRNVFSSPQYYYRAKVIDAQGKIYYTKTLLLIRGEQHMQPSVSPNPATDYLQLEVPADWQREEIYCSTFNSQGHRVLFENLKSGTNHKRIALQQLQPGSYVIELVSQSGKRWSQKFIITR
ncbi:MAG: T9SS type A sorting domain-containing protein, partial [Chitinophagaceae bacterium]